MNLTNTIMEAIEEHLAELMCRDCPHAEHSEATFYDPAWSECPGDGTPAEPGCRKHDEYEAVEGRVRECEMDIREIVSGSRVMSR